MPISKEQKAQSRAKILQAAFDLFARHGYNSVSIDSVMQQAGLTRGAFYNHFKTKTELYQQAFIVAAKQQRFFSLVPTGPFSRQDLVDTVEQYLTLAHLHGDIPACPLAHLSLDIGVDDVGVRATYEATFTEMQRKIGYVLDGDVELAGSLLSLLVGAMTVARTLSEREDQQRLLSQCFQSTKRIIMAA